MQERQSNTYSLPYLNNYPIKLPAYSSYNYNNYDYSNKKTDLDEKRNDIFTKILLSITDKLIYAFPQILQKYLGFSINELTYDYGGDYGTNYAVFKNLGIFGYFPIILLKLVDAFTYFMNTLKKNKFLRSFLVPILVLGLTAGSILFLIWFLQSDGYDSNDNNNYINYESNGKNYQTNNYNKYQTGTSFNNQYGENQSPMYYTNTNNMYDYQKSYNVPVYSRSYYENIR